MLAEVLQQLAIKKDGIYLDCTFGRGGHSREILQVLGESGKLLALDRDGQAINSIEAKGMHKDDRFTLIQSRFSELENIAVQQDCSGLVDGILMDIGVSSPQLDDAERGFSFMKDGPLDMRMDKTADESAEQWLAKVKEKDLTKVLFEFGEERFARRIAKAVVGQRREQNPITTTGQLAELIKKAVPFTDKHKHPATRSFQAIRIVINQELRELKQALEQAIVILKPGGRLVVISFHSLEDRIVKRFFRNESKGLDIGKLPIKEADIEQGRLKTISKALRASRQEIDTNLRARSAIMRVAERK